MPATRHLAFAFLGLSALALLVFSIWFRPQAPLADHIEVEVVSFEELPGWAAADLTQAMMAFQSSCDFVRRNAGDFVGDEGETAAWLEACAAVDSAMVVAMDIEVIARDFFEGIFTPLRIRNNQDRTGMFTGYYEPLLHGSRTQSDTYATPLLARPDDLVMVQLSEFPGDRSGRIAGRVEDGRLRPFEGRTEIEEGALKGAVPLVWIDDPVDAFFLHIQGSGRVQLEDGSVMRVGYAGQNGHPYTSIGRVLVQREAITLEEASMQSIRAWLAANPEEALQVMRENASYVFFDEISVSDPGRGPLGSAGVPLTPGYSLAVDRTYHALGAPIYVATELPDGEAFRRLMVAQDTGGAIRGPIRGDIFFGFGEEAGAIAGAMRGQGEMWVLVPNQVAAEIAASE